VGGCWGRLVIYKKNATDLRERHVFNKSMWVVVRSENTGTVTMGPKTLPIGIASWAESQVTSKRRGGREKAHSTPLDFSFEASRHRTKATAILSHEILLRKSEGVPLTMMDGSSEEEKDFAGILPLSIRHWRLLRNQGRKRGDPKRLGTGKGRIN